MHALDRYFGISAADSTLRREIVGGLTTFATMSYIIFVQPTVLSMAGMDFGGVLVATCLSAAFACVLMGLVARLPFALAPGMGENFLFTFTIVLGMGFSWQAGLAIVLVAGVLFVLLSLFGVRERVLHVLPGALKNSIGPAIGLFIAFVGLQWSGIVVLDPATMVTLGDLGQGPPLVCLAGVLVIAALLARGFRWGILAGILFTAVLGVVTRVIPFEYGAGNLNFSTFFQLDFTALLPRWDEALLAILLLFFLDLFDTVGTLVGVGTQAGFIRDDGALPRAGRAFFADALGTCAGALFGTSTVTTYIESASGVAAGARTGLAPMVTAICFVLALALAPVITVAGQNVGPAYYEALGIEHSMVSMYPAVAPALIVVGFLMLAPLRRVTWDDLTEAVPAFFTLAMMAFSYSITEGMAAGCISFTAMKLVTGRAREAHPVMYVVSAALVLRYVFLT